MKGKPGAFFAIFVMLLSLAVVIGALGLRFQSIKTLPIITGSLIFVLATIALVKELRGTKGPKPEEEELPLSNYWKTGAWIMGFALAIYLIGFLVTTPLFIISYLKVRGKTWRQCITIAVVTTGLMYLVFEFFLKVELYRGLLFTF